MADLICKQDHQDSLCRNFNSQGTCVGNSKALTLTQPKMKLQIFWPYAPCCANEYAKEEENTTTLTICHGTLLATICDYLQNDILL